MNSDLPEVRYGLILGELESTIERLHEQVFLPGEIAACLAECIVNLDATDIRN
jgi:hypothetical protein